jgi:DNA-binding transcriptional LysR family regulator
MRIEQLLAFKRVADERSYTRAAEKEFLTQPAIYSQIRQLESECGAKLVYVEGKEVLLTAAGHDLYRFADSVERASDEFNRRLRDRKQQSERWVRIGAASYFGVIADAAEQFRGEMPDGLVQFQSMGPEQAKEAIRSGSVDFGFFGSSYLEEGLTSEQCDFHQVVVVVRPGHPLAQAERPSFEELADSPVIGYAAGSARAAVHDLIAAEGLRPITYAAQADSSVAIKLMALSMDVPALLVAQAARQEILQGSLVVVDVQDFSPGYALHIVYDDEAALGAAALRFLQHIRELCGTAEAARRE